MGAKSSDYNIHDFPRETLAGHFSFHFFVELKEVQKKC